VKAPNPCATCSTDLSQERQTIEYDLPASELVPDRLVRCQLCAKCHELRGARAEADDPEQLELGVGA
jgi:hypothetical protein